jgi:hypothetical protein
MMSLIRSLTAYARLPDPRPINEVDEEIRDELEFHLEMRTLDGVRTGLTSEAARQRALDSFGDLARIHRDCRRILVGDRIMLQRLQAVLTLLLLAAVAFFGVRFYLWQRASDEAMAKMMQSLDQLAARSTQQSSSPPRELAAIYAATPPVVVETVPANGASDVDPAIGQIRATFSKPMMDQSWSWCTSDLSFPEIIGSPRYLDDGKTCVISVKLKPGTTYGIWLNSEKFGSFMDRQGRSAVPYMLKFTTRK